MNKGWLHLQGNISQMQMGGGVGQSEDELDDVKGDPGRV